MLNGAAIQTQAYGSGDAGNIKISTRSLLLSSFSEITASAQFRSSGKAGNIQIDATDSIKSVGSGGILTSVLGGTGDGGDITINTSQLTLQNGGTVSAQAITVGQGGRINIFASDSIDVIGSDGFIPSQITTGTFSLTNQPSGDISIRTRQLNVLEGGQITVETVGENPAGNLVIRASDSITISGTASFSNFSDVVSPSQLSARTREGPGGTISLITPKLNITNGAEITVSSRGVGRGGNLEIDADTIQLDNQGKIIGTSASGNGGNITLNVRDVLFMRRGSQISTTAGTAQAGGDGGNITVNTSRGFIIGVKSENSDITANAFTGSGGRVNVTAQGIFGLQFRSQLSPFSDITASSTFGRSGIVALNTPNVDPNRGLVQLPQNLIDTNRILANSCIVRNAASGGAFWVTGIGGLPEQPGTGLPVFAMGEVRGVEKTEGRRQEAADRKSNHNQQSKIENVELLMEAQGIYRLPDGQVILSWECPQ